MPLIEIKYFEQEFTDDERSGIIRAVTDAMVSFTGEAIRPHTWVVLEEVRMATGASAATPSDSRTSAPSKSLLATSGWALTSTPLRRGDRGR